MPTIKEIAQLAGVSRGTVDRVLNNRGSVSPATAERIKEIAERLNYQPNKAGLMLAAQKKNSKIGVVLCPDSDPFFKEMLEGVYAKEQELMGYNCAFIKKLVPFGEAEQFAAMEELLAEGIHGLVISPFNSPYIAAEIDRFSELGIPVITVHTDITARRMAYVGCNYRTSGNVAAGLMGRMTFGDVYAGIIAGEKHAYGHTERISGFFETIEQNYPHIRAVAIAENIGNDVEGYEQVTKMLGEYPEINALYFAAGGVYGGCQAIQASGRAAELRVFTYDCFPAVAEFVRNGIITATICQQPYRQGYLPVELLSRYLLEGVAPGREYNYVDAEIRIRENL